MSNYYTLQNSIISGVISSDIATGTAVKIIDSATEYIQPVTSISDDWCGVLMGNETVVNASGSTVNVAVRFCGNDIKVKLASNVRKGQSLVITSNGLWASGSNSVVLSGSAYYIIQADAIALQSGVTNDLIIAKIN
jgi:hypothetical protein